MTSHYAYLMIIVISINKTVDIVLHIYSWILCTVDWEIFTGKNIFASCLGGKN